MYGNDRRSTPWTVYPVLRNCSTMARPMPRAAPVTTAILVIQLPLVCDEIHPHKSDVQGRWTHTPAERAPGMQVFYSLVVVTVTASPTCINPVVRCTSFWPKKPHPVCGIGEHDTVIHPFASGVWVRSCARIACLRTVPQRYPSRRVSVWTTRWHGMMMATGFCAQACATARTAVG